MRNRQLKSIIVSALLCLAAGALFSTDALAKQCRDANGKFMKCPAATAAPATKCRDSKTKKFTKCDAPGAEPVQPKAN